MFQAISLEEAIQTLVLEHLAELLGIFHDLVQNTITQQDDRHRVRLNLKGQR